ncbi:nitroreductase [Hydrogenophaga sp. OTU3427]|uniref:nitroreductase n=1 Tax=Hydrogenophaga sp. OTU3427 TaxID=3043856 RepID=UPI00313DFB28
MNRLEPTPALPAATLQQAVDWAVVSRRSIRAFLPTPVSRDEVFAILDVARHTASGVNTQPWRVRVLSGASKERLSAAILAANDNPALAGDLREPYTYYPEQWVSPYIDRRRKVGWDLYGLLGIAKEDKPGMHAQHGRNYRFFDAPIGLIFTLDRVMQAGSLIDYGMFLQSIMVAARARSLDTCPQVAFTKFHQIIATELSIPDTEMVVCGMSLGHADPSRVENTLVTEREPVDAFASFLD